jgi:hypothetical protein
MNDDRRTSRPGISVESSPTASDIKRNKFSVKSDSHVSDGKTTLGDARVIHSESFLSHHSKRNKFASSGSVGTSLVGNLPFGGTGFGGSQSTASSVRMVPEIYSPLYQLANLQLPRDRRTMNAWNRAFYETNPYVRNSINLHATYPISKLRLKCHDKKILQFFEDMVEELNLWEVVQNVALEYWKIGEVFPFSRLNESTGKWNKIIIHNPDYIHVHRSVLANDPVVYLQPDEMLKRIVNGRTFQEQRLRQQLPPEILRLVRQNKNIPLDNFNVSHLKYLSSPYDGRGVSIIVCVYKDLMLYDKLRECKFAQADGLVNPITLVKLGDNENNRPSQEDLDEFRKIMEDAQFDKDFKLVTHASVAIERVGASGTVIDVGTDFEFIVKSILSGLMTPDSIINTEGPTYASASVGLEVLKGRYENFRTQIENWLVRKIFAPIAKIQDYYETKDKEKRLIVPQIVWNKMNLRDVNTYIDHLKALADATMVTGEGESAQPHLGRISAGAVLESLDIDFDEDLKRRKEEAIKILILQKEIATLKDLDLDELRSIDPDQPITEQTKREKERNKNDIFDKQQGSEVEPGTAPGTEEFPIKSLMEATPGVEPTTKETPLSLEALPPKAPPAPPGGTTGTET